MARTITEKEIQDRQRLAWIILLSSFFICTVLTISFPFGVNAVLQNSTELLDIFVQSNKGTVRIDNENGDGRAVLEGDSGQMMYPGSTVVTGNTQTALLFLSPPESEQRLARLQVYSHTTLRLVEADSPQFSVSEQLHEAIIKLESGRLLISLSQFEERPFQLIINTPQGRIAFAHAGQYIVIVDNESTEVIVQEGMATVSAVVEVGVRDVVYLEADQRAEIPTGLQPRGPLNTSRNLITNSDFSKGKSGWTFFAWQIQEADQPKGETAVTYIFGEPRLHIIRDGSGHADLRIRQNIQRDVTDIDVLELSLTFRILGQSLQVCGIVGSECPLFVRINYVDANGITQTWQQGFFASGEIIENSTPDGCISCAVIQSSHQRVTVAQDTFYEVDFAAEIARQGALPPRFIESIELVTSGHGFNLEIVDVNLLLEE